MTQLADSIKKIRQGGILTEEEMTAAMQSIVNGDANDDDSGAFLTSLARRGEAPVEIMAAAKYLRSRASTINAPQGAIDCCGTGGDRFSTYNVSTAVAFIGAGCGATIAKHGNRSASSKCGAADVLEKVGVPLELPPEKLEDALYDIGFCFLFAASHHAAMKHVARLRRQLGSRTIFNLLGPLLNPANATKQLVGVYDAKWVVPMAEALKLLGAEQAIVVHGSDGMDEITLSGPTQAAFLDNGQITERTLTPEEFNLPTIRHEDIRGGDAATNAKALMAVLNGEPSAYYNVVLANAAAVLHLHDGRDFATGVLDADYAIRNGQALKVLEDYKKLADA